MAEWDESVDVIVVGSGFAGLTAAVEARNAGSSVIVLEKMRAAGGNSIISDGGFAAAGTELQRRLGIDDCPELFYQDMLKAGLGLNDPALARTVTQRAADVLRWSADYLGVRYLDRADRFGGHSAARCYAVAGTGGAALVKALLKKTAELDVPLRTGCALRTLLTENGVARGVVIEQQYNPRSGRGGSLKRLRAQGGIVIATGGFGADTPFRMLQDPRLNADIDTTNRESATSEALVEAVRIGAACVHLSHIQLGPWASPDEKGFGSGPRFADYVGFLYGVVVDPLTAERFVNEQSDRKVLSDAILRVGKPCICIADQAAVQRSGWNIARAVRKGVVKGFTDLDELARHYGLPSQRLARTISEFNQAVQRGTDHRFQRSIPPDSEPIENPPFLAMRLWPKVHYTMGGLSIDQRARVMDLQGRPISGLFAAGEVTGGVHGACRLGSCGITDCLVFGRIAGREAGTRCTNRGVRASGKDLPLSTDSTRGVAADSPTAGDRQH
ncbi:MAG: flavocytochrome c [Spirochaetaceae bacterium]|nr:MAG: flavocytochrome c [Spirochaetaceae bacterium]